MINVLVPEFDVNKLEDLVRLGFYSNRSEAVRFAIKDLIKLHEMSIKGIATQNRGSADEVKWLR